MSFKKIFNRNSWFYIYINFVLLIFLVIYFIGQIEMPSPNKLIKQEIPNEKLITVK